LNDLLGFRKKHPTSHFTKLSPNHLKTWQHSYTGPAQESWTGFFLLATH